MTCARCGLPIDGPRHTRPDGRTVHPECCPCRTAERGTRRPERTAP